MTSAIRSNPLKSPYLPWDTLSRLRPYVHQVFYRFASWSKTSGSVHNEYTAARYDYIIYAKRFGTAFSYQ